MDTDEVAKKLSKILKKKKIKSIRLICSTDDIDLLVLVPKILSAVEVRYDIPTYLTVKTKKRHIDLASSINEKAIKKCEKLGVSMSETINKLLQNWINE